MSCQAEPHEHVHAAVLQNAAEVLLLTVGCTHQALRQSLLKKYSRVRRDLDSLHNSRMSAYEKAECLESIRAQIQSSWRTDEIRRGKPTPQVSCAKVQQCLSCTLQYHLTHTCTEYGCTSD